MASPPDPPRPAVHVVPWLRRPGGLLLRNWLAITIGRHIWAWRPLDARELRHEVEHVRQWAAGGPRFAAVYLRASYRAWRAGGQWYGDNRYERAARAAADGFEPLKLGDPPGR